MQNQHMPTLHLYSMVKSPSGECPWHGSQVHQGLGLVIQLSYVAAVMVSLCLRTAKLCSQESVHVHTYVSLCGMGQCPWLLMQPQHSVSLSFVVLQQLQKHATS